MSMLGGSLVGARVLDLYAGSGALGLEALSRGAASVVFVERSGRALRTLGDNVEGLGADEDEVRVVRGDALEFVAGLEEGAFDVALADPPYGGGAAARLLEAWGRRPFAPELWVEHASGESLPELAGLRSRRYGDTTLTRISVDR